MKTVAVVSFGVEARLSVFWTFVFAWQWSQAYEAELLIAVDAIHMVAGVVERNENVASWTTLVAILESKFDCFFVFWAHCALMLAFLLLNSCVYASVWKAQVWGRRDQLWEGCQHMLF